MTVWFGNTPDAYTVDKDTGKPTAGMTAQLYTDVARTIRATGLVDEDGTPSESSLPATADRIIGSTVTSKSYGILSFGAPDGTLRLYYDRGDGTSGVLTPRSDLAYAPRPTGTPGVGKVPVGTDSLGNTQWNTGVPGNDSRVVSETGPTARAFFGTVSSGGVRTEAGSIERSDSKWWGIWKKHPTSGKKYLAIGVRSSDGSVWPPALNKALVPDVGELTGDSIAGRFLQFAADISAAMGSSAVATTGQGGQPWASVTARGGAEPARITVTGGVIPASGSVACSIDRELRPDTVFVQGVVSEVQVQYVATETTITPDPDDPGGGSTSYLTGTLTRIGTGTPVRVPPGSAFQRNPTITVSSGPVPLRKVPLRNGGLILLPGRHDQQRDPGIVIDLLRKQLDNLSTDARRKSIVCACLPWCAGAQAQPIGSALRPQLDWMNRLLLNHFPRHFVDINAWLQSADTILAVTGNAATSQDLTDIAAGITPTTFRIQADGSTVDPGHPGPDAVRAMIALFGMHYQANGFGPTQWVF